ncbi:uncharacterized protein A1O9_10194 [Exophiala aquamarina CBS 119918]|uniref:Uncharacterized protein n=1 Tax=Exophiala aquamarina CBS 119918 TaxID=1182545 RepID=A0A072P3H2_9EURO|nr:uncharacterized protein A1O9_10194 [Exophiala aquamarina CBS 119918]KEF53793.1 hypothetical protein A1O9_10194 [Exophiala aquamarina CBS 119918]
MTTESLTFKSANSSVNGALKDCLTATAASKDANLAPSRTRRPLPPELFSENVVAKIIRTAKERLANNNPPVQYPELVPQTGSSPEFGLIWSNPIHGEATLTNTQGYDATTTWSRGQAWAILGYAQTYTWTGEPDFLDIACGVSEYYLLKLETTPSCVEVEVKIAHLGHESKYKTIKTGRYVPLWDFNAPIGGSSSLSLRDPSAGMAAANGLLVLSQSPSGQAEHKLSARYLDAARRIVRENIEYSLTSVLAPK